MLWLVRHSVVSGGGRGVGQMAPNVCFAWAPFVLEQALALEVHLELKITFDRGAYKTYLYFRLSSMDSIPLRTGISPYNISMVFRFPLWI